MAGRLADMRIAILATDGVEQVELTEPRDAVAREGAQAMIVSPAEGPIRAMNHDVEPGDTFDVDVPAGEATASGFDALIMPGGTVNADRLRMDDDVRVFVREMVLAGLPVGVICHGPWTLIDAGVAKGRTLTSYPSVWTDLRNAGAIVVDHEVVIDDGMVSSRSPRDLPAFCTAIVETFAARRLTEFAE